MSAQTPSERVIDGRFTLVERLGSGGMGMVWRARDLALHRDVALKEVRPPDPALADYDPEGARTLRARVLREARALARLDHPNVVTVHHIVDPGEDAYPWIVMELVPGSSLHDRLAEGPMAPAEAAGLGRGILCALRAAHACGIQHRDVKPANVLLRTDGRPVLTDFGIAAIRESTSLTMTGALIGSPDYIAPERIRGVEGDPSSDLWSLGMMLYVAVEGVHPLRRATTLATLAAVLDEEIPPPVRAGALAPVLTALLTRDLAARPDAETLERMLADAANGVHGAAPTPTGPPQDSYASPSPPTLAENENENQGEGERRSSPARRTTRRLAIASSAGAAAVLAGVALWAVGPLSLGGGADDDRRTSANPTVDGFGPAPAPPAPAAGGAAGDAVGEKETAPAESLLTPAGARAAVQALKPLMGGTEVTDFTLYDEHASAQAPLKSNSRLYDRFSYRDGMAKNDDMGGTLISGEKPVDLEDVDWDALPALLRTAATTLDIPQLESRYVILDPSSPFHGDRPVLRVYVSDRYGGAFLTADLDGRVIEKNPREKG
ncbi:serine/threonine-protein kinase [Streptomyces sp. NPDC088729]|uniref:serine/threonine-protein kinase n=1 Tax=Streptomyces sp. NPDC088729 TaxID=3365876 RepID=UPI003800EEA1